MREVKIVRLSDEFGQYLIVITCPCGHGRKCHPKTFADIAGWDATLADVVSRCRCSKCNRKTCQVRTYVEPKPRGLRDAR